MKPQVCYRKLKGYKYITHETMICQTPYRPREMLFIRNGDGLAVIELSPSGMLTVWAGYAWDGPSGPTFDTDSFMRGSCYHDAAYQLMRMSLLDTAWRKAADNLLVDHCREDGMSKIRSSWVYAGVRSIFGRWAAAPRDVQPEKVYRAP